MATCQYTNVKGLDDLEWRGYFLTLVKTLFLSQRFFHMIKVNFLKESLIPAIFLFPKCQVHIYKRRICEQRAQDDSGRPGPGLGRICAVWELRRDVEPLSRGAAAASRCETSVREELWDLGAEWSDLTWWCAPSRGSRVCSTLSWSSWGWLGGFSPASRFWELLKSTPLSGCE